jgi:hypothetical protein
VLDLVEPARRIGVGGKPGRGKGRDVHRTPPTMSIGHGGVNGAGVPTPTPHALATVRVLLIEEEPDSRDLARA